MDAQEKERRLALAMASVPQVDPAEVDARHAQGTVVIDVRDAQAHAVARIAGSVNLEGTTIAEHIASLVPDRSTPILCYCNGGSRGPIAALALQELGYTDVGAIAGGLRAYEALGEGSAWFEEYSSRLEGQPAELPLRCPCCFCRTLDERGAFEICEVCFWEDDGQDEYDADVVRGGPNGDLSLTRARSNFRQLGACDARSLAHVRPPTPGELPGEGTA